MSNKTTKWGLLLGAWVALEAEGATIPVKVENVSNTQAILSYPASGKVPTCTVEVWEGANGAASGNALVHDVNPVLFTGASGDGRPGNLASGGRRQVVIGRRRAEKALNGKYYSRALQVDTPHTARVTCGGDQGEVRFTTANLPLGVTQPENPAFDPEAFGNVPWPTIDWADGDATYIDPMTGVLIKRLTRVGEWASRIRRQFSENWALAGAEWSQPQNATSGTATGLASTGVAGAPLFLALRAETWPPGHVGGFLPDTQADDLAIRVYGQGSAASAGDRTVRVCLSVDSGQSCYTDEIPVVLPAGTAAEAGLFPSNFPAPMYRGWGNLPIQKRHWPRAGWVTVAAGLVTLTRNIFTGTVPGSEWDSASVFDAEWKPGTRVWISGSPCQQQMCSIAEVVNGYQLRLVETFTLAETEYKSAHLGFRIVKAGSTGTVSVSARYEYVWSFSFTLPYTGGTDQCGLQKVTTSVDRTGKPLTAPRQGYLCVLPFSSQGNGALYFVDTANGDFRFLSAFRTPSSIAGHVAADLPSASVTNAGVATSTFDPDTPTTMYTSAKTNGGRRALFKLTYTGDFRALDLNFSGGEGGDTSRLIPDGMTWENVTKSSASRDLQTQIDQRYPQYDKERFGTVEEANQAGVVSHYVMFTRNLGGQDSACWNFVFDLRTGDLQKAFNSFDGTADPLMRWAGCHSTSVAGPYFGVSTNVLKLNNTGAVYGGPFTARITALRRGGAFQTNTSLGWIDNSYDNACPAGLDARWVSLGAVGNRCITIRVEGEPCSVAATAREKIWTPCPNRQNASILLPWQEGDMVTDAGYPPNPDAERLRVVRRSNLSGGEVELVLQRNAATVYCAYAEPGNTGLGGIFQVTHADGWSLMPAPAGETCEGGFVYYDPETSLFLQENRYLLSGHFDLGTAPSDGNLTMLGTGYLVRYNQPPTNVTGREDRRIVRDPTFDGTTAYNSSALLQSYGSLRQWKAPAEERRWGLDYRHINGSLGLRPEAPRQTLGPVRPALTPEPGTRNVYKLPVIGTVDYKRLPLLSFAGAYFLGEMSSPATGNVLTDAQPWRFCYAYRAGECRAGSQAGDLFATVPGAMPFDQCWVSQYALNVPCAMTAHPHGAWLVQLDVSKADVTGSGFRRLGMGFTGPGRQYVYANARATPDGKWVMFPGFWLNGARQEVMAAKLPPFRNPDTRNRASFLPFTVRLTGAPPVGNQVAVAFGYTEFGAPGDFYCTARQEKCLVGGAATPAPFALAGEFSGLNHAVACASGCSVKVPAAADRVLYYRIEYFDAQGARVGAGPTRAVIP